jgi:hypothetical protein
MEVVMAVNVPGKIQIVSQRQLPLEDYTPFHGILSPLSCKAIKAMTCINFRTYFVVLLGNGGIVSSCSHVKRYVRAERKLDLTIRVQNP